MYMFNTYVFLSISRFVAVIFTAHTETNTVCKDANTVRHIAPCRNTSSEMNSKWYSLEEANGSPLLPPSVVSSPFPPLPRLPLSLPPLYIFVRSDLEPSSLLSILRAVPHVLVKHQKEPLYLWSLVRVFLCFRWYLYCYKVVSNKLTSIHINALWPMEESSILSAQLDCPETHHNVSFLPITHDYGNWFIHLLSSLCYVNILLAESLVR